MGNIDQQVKGAWNIMCARAFYNTDGTVSLIKVASIIILIGLAVFFCPTFLTTVICIGFFCAAFYLFIPVIKALINGDLSAAANANKKNTDI